MYSLDLGNPNLLNLDGDSLLVAWDYCLENDIAMPGDILLTEWHRWYVYTSMTSTDICVSWSGSGFWRVRSSRSSYSWRSWSANG